MLKHKSFHGGTFKVLDDATGRFQAIVSVTGNVDSDGEVIVPGAYKESLAKRKPIGVWSHDWSIWVGRTLSQEELMPGDTRLPDAFKGKGWGGVLIDGEFNLDTQAGRDAWSNVKFITQDGETSEWSVGFKVLGSEQVKEEKDRKAPNHWNNITKIELFEWSPVLVGANPETVTVGVKAVKTVLEGIAGKRLGSDDGGRIDELASKIVAQLVKAPGWTNAEAKTYVDVDIEGSYEDAIDDVRDALRTWAAVWAGPFGFETYAWYIWPIATFPDHVIAQFENPNGCQYLDFPYTTDADGNVTLGQAVLVEVQANITPAKALSRELAAKVGARHSAADQASIQSAHDAITKAGALCDPANLPEEDKSMSNKVTGHTHDDAPENISDHLKADKPQGHGYADDDLPDNTKAMHAAHAEDHGGDITKPAKSAEPVMGTCGACEADGEIVMLGDVGYCEACTKAMKQAATGQGRVAVAPDVLLELSIDELESADA